jgi:hypothetical protein
MFYDDPEKTACDALSLSKAYQLRSFSLEPGVRWQAHRWMKFLAQYAVGTLRRRREGRRVAPAHGSRPLAPSLAQDHGPRA